MEITKRTVLTPANAITILGLLLTVWGSLYLDEIVGLALVAAGRLLDLVDGPVARATRSTEFSVFLDPTADKLALLAILIGIFRFHTVPWPIIGYILLQNALVSWLSIGAHRQRKAVGALIPGKLNLFFQQSAIMLFTASHLATGGLTHTATTLAYACFVASLPLAFFAIKAYAGLLKQ